MRRCWEIRVGKKKRFLDILSSISFWVTSALYCLWAILRSTSYRILIVIQIHLIHRNASGIQLNELTITLCILPSFLYICKFISSTLMSHKWVSSFGFSVEPAMTFVLFKFQWDYTSVLVCQGCHNKVSQTGWLKQQRCIFSWFQKPEVLDQGVCRIGFS